MNTKLQFWASLAVCLTATGVVAWYTWTEEKKYRLLKREVDRFEQAKKVEQSAPAEKAGPTLEVVAIEGNGEKIVMERKA